MGELLERKVGKPMYLCNEKKGKKRNTPYTYEKQEPPAGLKRAG